MFIVSSRLINCQTFELQTAWRQRLLRPDYQSACSVCRPYCSDSETAVFLSVRTLVIVSLLFVRVAIMLSTHSYSENGKMKDYHYTGPVEHKFSPYAFNGG